MKKKKKASTLVTLIIVIMVLSTVGAALISLTFSGYRARIGETNRLENLYGAESGLDLSYNIIANSIEKAIDQGEKAVKASGETNYDKCNDIFKKDVSDYLMVNLKNNIENRIWFDVKNNSSKDIKLDNDKGNFKVDSKVKAVDGSKVKVGAIEYYKQFDIKLTSTFQCNNKNGEGNKISRVIEARYTINIPDYLNIKYQTIYNKDYKNYKQVIAVDGDIDLSGKVKINGDIYAKGSSNNQYTGIKNKYNGGINLSPLAEVSVNKGNIITPRTIQINSNAQLIAEDIYGGNINFGKKCSSDNAAKNGEIKANSLCLRNDLAINSVGAIVNIKSFYGINDFYSLSKTNDGSNKETVVTRGNEDLSSSIIINENSATINISDEAYIWGAAFVNSYETGESVSVKGNYKAYSYPLPLTSGDAKFKYQDSMQLLYKIGDEEVTVFDKATYIKEYDDISKESNFSIDKPGTISLPVNNTYSIASYITKSTDEKGQLIKGTDLDTLINKQEEVTKKQEEYTEKVFGMGSYNWNESDDKTEVFANGEIKKSVSKGSTTDGLVDFSKITSEINQNSLTIKDKDGLEKEMWITLNKDEEKDVVIVGKDIDDSKYKDSKYIKINGDRINGLIVTAGDVIVTGEVNFTGSILAKGNLKVENDEKEKVFTSGGTYVDKILQYEKISKDIIEIPDTVTEPESIVSDRVDANKPYKIKDAIVKKLWKVKK
ncbi:Hypothetical protein CM240_0543 [Clostridium bornimense]|uniref:Uncharacterized protein n=1 Tax=Clostridium bornimense TaxID=1216932 RepID=W6RTT6_9CLOT|nr:hypothetical protein [Clostridium bornimense]CDM67708.1 Hypothetical protein CM240_0543 [Clostridium bornimense]